MVSQLGVRSAALTDVGKRRSNNEDAFLVSPEHHLYVVADGMGGHAAGEVASRMAVELLKQAISEGDPAPPCNAPNIAPNIATHLSAESRAAIREWLERTVKRVNALIHQAGQVDLSCHGMGSTLVALLIRGDTAFIAHVGDSRAYLRTAAPCAPSDASSAELRQLTTDHTLGQLLLSAGQITRDQLATLPHRGMLTRAIGTMPQVQVDTLDVRLSSGDRLLLCSDGLYNQVSDDKVHELLGRDLEQVAGALVQAALARGGHDNITTVVIEIHDRDGEREGPGPATMDNTDAGASPPAADPAAVGADRL